MVEALLNGLAAGALNGAPAGRIGGTEPAATGRTAGTESGATRFAEPLLAVMLWAAMLCSEGKLDPRALAHLGADAEKLAALAAQHPDEIEQLRWLRLAGTLFSQDALAALLRGRLSEMLMGATKASELLALTKMMERMPDWMWGEEQLSADSCQLSAQNGGGGVRPPAQDGNPGSSQDKYADAINGIPTGADEIEALLLLREMLAAKPENTSESQIDDMLLRAQALADRLDPSGSVVVPQLPRQPRKPSYTKKRARRQ